MKDKDHSDPTPPAIEDPGRSADLALRKLGHKDHFLRLMLFQPSEEIETLRERQGPHPTTGQYTPAPVEGKLLRLLSAEANDSYVGTTGLAGDRRDDRPAQGGGRNDWPFEPDQ